MNADAGALGVRLPGARQRSGPQGPRDHGTRPHPSLPRTLGSPPCGRPCVLGAPGAGGDPWGLREPCGHLPPGVLWSRGRSQWQEPGAWCCLGPMHILGRPLGDVSGFWRDRRGRHGDPGAPPRHRASAGGSCVPPGGASGARGARRSPGLQGSPPGLAPGWGRRPLGGEMLGCPAAVKANVVCLSPPNEPALVPHGACNGLI